MHRLLVTIALLLLPLVAGCGGFTNPLTGTTVGGGVVSHTSRLLGTPLPAGMEFYSEHSRIEGQDGMEVLRGTASPAMCARTVCDALQADGWSIRLGYATETRALYVFEKQGRVAAISILPQASLTLMTIYTSSMPPASIPIPFTKKPDYSFGFGSSSASNTDTSSPDIPPMEEGTGGLSTAPESPQGGSGQLQERDL